MVQTSIPLHADLAVTAATVIAQTSPLVIYSPGLLLVRGDRLIWVGPAEGPEQGWQAARHLQLDHQLVVPGFVNVHTHAILTMVRGVAEDMGFAPAYTPGVPHGHEVSPDEAVALARLGALEAMLFGSTLINDSYVHADLTLPAMAELGLRVSSCGRIHDVDFSRVHLGEWRHDPAIGERTLADACALHERWQGQFEGRASVQFTPHAPDTCSKALLRTIGDEARSRGLRVATHLSQSLKENRRVEERDGCSPTELLEDTGLLNERLIAAHGMYLSGSDIARAGRAGIHLAHVPKGNATGGRIAPTRAMARAGIRLALATDNMHADMIEVMRWALCMGRIQEECIDDTWQPETMLDCATRIGAQAMGLAEDIGSLEVGKKADFVAIDLWRAHLVPFDDPLGVVVHNGHGRDVTTVIVDGRIVVESGRATLVDSDKILHEGLAASRALWERARAQTTR
jgi:5-methylthioadenosine/S-adenosylhomocysteine deaminase